MVINPRFPKELIFFSDVKDAVADAATRIFLTGKEICHDTLVECLSDRQAYANIVEDNYTAVSVNPAPYVAIKPVLVT